jgi:hypothetical protein
VPLKMKSLLLGTKNCVENERASVTEHLRRQLGIPEMGTTMNLANPLSDLAKMFLVIGIALVAVGTLLLFGVKLPFRPGRLPGDIAYQGRHGSFYFPIATCIVLSLALTLLMWIINFFRR